MKSIYKLLIICTIAKLGMYTADAQSSSKFVSTQFTVDGTCTTCEKRIESTSLLKGVRIADWSKDNKILKVTYLASKTDTLKIAQVLANAGHDNKYMKASNDAYNKLPDCCKYRNGIETH